MGSSAPLGDLIVLVADKDMEATIRGLLSRPAALGIPQLTFSVVPHAERDPGCILRGPELLRTYLRGYRHALLLVDREGSGQEHSSRAVLESELERRLAADWQDRAAAIVLDPELEAWVWSDSPHVEEVLGWKGREPNLRSWLGAGGLWQNEALKPRLPKEAVEKALFAARKPRSSALYQQLAERVSFQRCRDPAFLKLLRTLRSWFPLPTG